MDRYPADGGLPELDPVTAETAVGEAPGIPAGVAVPDNVVAKVPRALEAPVDELVARGVINSGEVLAKVLPQLTASLLAANLDDAEIEPVYALTYAAFRRRRSLLLLNLEHQVQFGELPWIAALEPLRAHRPDTKRAALGTLRQATMLALTAFPAAILPNPLVRELGALATEAGLSVPLVEEVAADIFMGTFTVKWRLAAERASALLAGSLYARYYDLPDAGTWAAAPRPRRKRPRWARRTADDFAAACAARAREAQLDAGSRSPGTARCWSRARSCPRTTSPCSWTRWTCASRSGTWPRNWPTGSCAGWCAGRPCRAPTGTPRSR
ncbi:MAG TPA: hypothetical protein VFV67_16315 [Actinophytocola sp.]|uniref:hypothetical protein n=1 Tax=Actinophytocola sp. TaxID=1872138 RepID=UPI002DBE941B|nr:hypothetical protein [Actinophytocola sp.]HEU5472219.1 hypothetical protein [Actinophytocola sp.]